MFNINLTRNILDYYYIRILRNKNKDSFSRNNSNISIFNQLLFFFFKSKNYDVYIIKFEGARVGYVLIQKLSNLWITECIDEKYRGMKIASKTIDFIFNKYKKDIYAEILKKNKASINLHIKNKFIFLKNKKTSTIFVRRYID